jgi:AcrR family transcriptional regulator
MTNENEPTTPIPRRRRVDAQRNVDALLEAAKTVFDTTGVDAPVKEIAQEAGVGVGTLYRHFPRRADLVKAVVESRIDALAECGPQLAATHDPETALVQWLHRYTALLGTKRGLASALHSGDPTFDGLRDHFHARLEPTADALLHAAVSAGAIRRDVSARELLRAIALLCLPLSDDDPVPDPHMVEVFIDGLRRTGGVVA